MKKLLLSVFALATVGVAAASVQSLPRVIKSVDELPEIGSGVEYNSIIYQMPEKAEVSSLSRADQAVTHTVTVNYTYDESLYFPDFPTLYAPGYRKYGFVMNKTASMVVPEGTYSFVTSFMNLGVPHAPGTFLIIKDDIVVDKDLTIEVDPSEAKNFIKFSSVLPGGVETVLPKVDVDDYYEVPKEDYDWEGANVKEIGTYTIVSSDHIGVLSVGATNLVVLTPSGDQSMERLGVAVNDVDERWHFTQTRYAATLDDNYYYSLSAVNGSSVLEAPVNDPQFIQWDYNFVKSTPLMEALGDDGWHYGVAPYTIINGAPYMGFRSYTKDAEPKFYFSAPKSTNTDKYNANYGVQITRNEFALNNGSTCAGIKSPIAYYDTEVNDLQYSAIGALLFGSPLQDGTGVKVIPGNVNFACSPSTQKYPLGSSAPYSVTSFESEDWDDYFEYELHHAYVGNYGEGRGGDYSMTTVFINIEGEDEITCSYAKLDDQISKLSEENKFEKPFTIEFFDDQNILIDNIKGKNVTTLDFGNHERGELYGPTVTMLQFRDAEGLPDNRFVFGEEAKLFITGGRFVLTEPNTYACEEAELKVEYAPAETEKFVELPVEEEKDNYGMPYGYFWYASLKDIKTVSDNGWYELRVTITDKEGNSQVQNIYPAFYIDPTTGIDTVGADSYTSDVEYYNLQGIRLSAPVSGSVVIRRQGSEVSKIYVK